MVNYSNGKIYKIIGNDEESIYIGSTTRKYLSQRMDTHRRAYNNWQNGEGGKITSFEIFNKYGVDNCKIILLENCQVDTKDELRTREQHYIDMYKNICVNNHRAIGFDIDRRKDYKKVYDKAYSQTKHYKEYQMNYRTDHNEQNKEYQKKYREANREKNKQYMKEYYQKRKNLRNNKDD